MIFISYNHKDKEVVKEIALRMSNAFGRNNIFFDEWSIRPGDAIIDKMNDGLKESQFFFFFVSKNSLESKMVKLEWQNALMNKAKNNDFLFVPVRIDDSDMPAILLQVLYIDLFSNGLEYAVRQMIDTVNRQNTSVIEQHSFKNLLAERYYLNDGCSERIVFRAKYFFEPTTQFIILTTYSSEEIIIDTQSCKSDGMFFSSAVVQSPLKDLFSFSIKVDRGLTPDNPLVFDISVKTKNKGNIVFGILHLKGPNKSEAVDLIEKQSE